MKPIQWKEPRDYDPRKMLYPDRKMLKYQGMLLSDHREQRLLEENKQKKSALNIKKIWNIF